MNDPRDTLRADCGRCFGLCCVVPAFSASSDFAITKPAGRACPNLQRDFRCGVHTQLRVIGFPGCTAYDCFGAGQKVSQQTFGGQDWRSAPETATSMFAVFEVMRVLHELLWYLSEARTLRVGAALDADLARLQARTERFTEAPPEVLVAMDVEAHRAAVSDALERTSELVRARAPGRRKEHGGAGLVGRNLRGADLLGKNLRRADLAAANLRGAHLIRADLRGADLRLADVIGADLRGADLRGADLTGCLFLTQPQVSSATGDATTRLPERVRVPSHWSHGR